MSKNSRCHLLLGSLAMAVSIATAVLLLSPATLAAKSGACYGTISYWPNPGQVSAKPTCHSVHCLPCAWGARPDQNGKRYYVCACPGVAIVCEVGVPLSSDWQPGQPLWTCFNPTCGGNNPVCDDRSDPVEGNPNQQTVYCDCFAQ